MWVMRCRFRAVLTALSLTLAGTGLPAAELLNASYDPTRELYKDVNAAFAAEWKAKTGEDLTVRMSHGGSGKQARAVIDGLGADVVTLALALDIDHIAKATGKLPADWQSRLPNASNPYTSTIVFLVRKGNPKGVKDWGDLVREDVKVLTPNPKTSGGARWNYLAAWIYAQKQFAGDEAKMRQFIGDLYRNVPVLDTAARGSTTNFAQRGLGDVLVTWENEAYLTLDAFGADRFDIILPSISVRAEPSVALIDANVDERGTRAVAEAYLAFLYSDEGQRLAAKHHYRPARPELAAPEDRLPEMTLMRVEDTVGPWAKVQTEHFGENGIFDQIYKAVR